MLLGQQIEVFADHKNPVHKHFNAERVVRWRLLLEEFGPKLTHIKGANNAVADALSRLKTAEEELSAEALANELANEEEDNRASSLPQRNGLPSKEGQSAAKQVKGATQTVC